MSAILSIFVSSILLFICSFGMKSPLVAALSRNFAIHTKFVLIATHHKGNVGAAARALKTMGFDDLRLVSPRDPKVLNRQRTKEAASGAVDVLEQTQIHSSLQDAVEDCNIVCATGMPHSMSLTRPEYSYVAPRVYFERLLKFHDTNDDVSIALVFGNERVGMSQDDIQQCDVVLGIPTNPVSNGICREICRLTVAKSHSCFIIAEVWIIESSFSSAADCVRLARSNRQFQC